MKRCALVVLLVACHSPSAQPTVDASVAAARADTGPSPSSAPSSGSPAIDEFAGEQHWPFLGPIASLEALCKEVDDEYTRVVAPPGAGCAIASRRTLSARGPFLEVAVYLPASAFKERRSGLREEFLALRTSKGWFAQQRSPHDLPRASAIPLDRAQETNGGFLFIVPEQVPVTISERPPVIHGANRTTEKTMHCRTDEQGVPACTIRLPRADGGTAKP